MNPPPYSVRTKKKFFTTLAFAAAFSVATLSITPAANAQATDASLKATIDTILKDPSVEGAQTGVLVRDANDGSVVYDHNGKSLLIPASNTKLYSSTAALKVLSEGYTFRTTVGTMGTLTNKGTVLKGDLFLKGRGDPTLRAEDYNKLAKQLAAKGITTIKGQIIADDTYFDAQRLGYNWGWDSNPYYYQPEISALTVASDDNLNIGALSVVTIPGKEGKPA